MSTKFVQFLSTTFFVSLLICLIMEGTYFGTTERGLLQNLILIRSLQVGSWSLPVFNPGFVNGLFDLLTWHYSFYEGQYQILRWFWTATLTPGAVWAILQVVIYILGQLFSLLRVVPV